MSVETQEPEKAGQSTPKHGRDLTTGSVPRHLIAFAVPMLFGSLLQTSYSFINAFWVSRGIGKSALAAVTDSFPVIFVLVAAAIGLTMASNILSSQAYGAKDWTYLRRVVGNSMVLVGTLSLICVAAGVTYARTLLVAMQTPGDILPMAAGYMRIIVWSMPAQFGVFLMASLLRGTGDSTTPLYFQAVSLGSTAILDPILMFGWLGFPRLGLNGTAVATIIANFGALIALSLYLRRKRHIIAPNRLHLRLDWETTWLLIRVGVPSMAQQVFFSVGVVVIISLVNTFGENGVTAYGAATRIDNFAFMPALTVGMAVSALAGQNIGAKQYHRVQEVFKWGLIIGCGMTSVGVLFLVSIPDLLLRIFLRDPAIIQIGVHYLRIVGASYVLLAVLFVSNGVINGAGHTLVTTIISLVSLWAIRVPMAMYLSRRMHSIEGIWYAIAIGFAVGTIASLSYYFSGRWKRPIRRAMVAQEPPALEVVPLNDALVE